MIHFFVEIAAFLRNRLMPHYNNAPITEAIIDIRAESAVQFEDLQNIRKRLSDYPHEEARNLGEGMIQFGPSVQATAHQRPWALVFRNQDGNQVLQIRLDGLTFSRLAPYEDFERLRDEAKRLWGFYREIAHPGKITRVAVRYVNQLNLPAATTVEPAEYLNTFPQISDKLPAELRDFGPFLMHLRMLQYDLKGTMVINEGNTPPKSPDTISIVLDLDLFVENPPVSNEQELWEFFDKLRARKNIYFEACITDKTRELIR